LTPSLVRLPQCILTYPGHWRCCPAKHGRFSCVSMGNDIAQVCRRESPSECSCRHRVHSPPFARRQHQAWKIHRSMTDLINPILSWFWPRDEPSLCAVSNCIFFVGSLKPSVRCSIPEASPRFRWPCLGFPRHVAAICCSQTSHLITFDRIHMYRFAERDMFARSVSSTTSFLDHAACSPCQETERRVEVLRQSMQTHGDISLSELQL
jgi:hypothetical protein